MEINLKPRGIFAHGRRERQRWREGGISPAGSAITCHAMLLAPTEDIVYNRAL